MKQTGSKTVNEYSFDSFEEMLKWIQAGRNGSRYAVYNDVGERTELVATSDGDWNNDGFMMHYLDCDEWNMLCGWIDGNGKVDEDSIKEEYDLSKFTGYEEIHNDL